MMPQVTAAALVSENKVLAHPASVDSITTSGNKEDYVSMGMTAALQTQAHRREHAQRAGDRGHGRGPGDRLPGSAENFEARAGSACGDPVGVPEDGEGSGDVKDFARLAELIAGGKVAEALR